MSRLLAASMPVCRNQVHSSSGAIAVLILYSTASTDLHGELHYYRDVYERDASLLRELD
jgi:murein L,D-transpeptidase YcbB/YkuD